MLNIQAQKINSSNLEAQFNQSICIYRNETEVLQIVRISKPNVAFFERVVFPNQCIQFSAPIDALLEICEGSLSSLIHADTIPCSQIAIEDMDMDMGMAVGRAGSVLKESNKDSWTAIAV
jgi:hypothetical protein